MADISVGVQAARIFENEGWGFQELDISRFSNMQKWYLRLKERTAFQEHVIPHAKR